MCTLVAMVQAGGCRDRPRWAVHAAEDARPRLGIARPAVPQRGVAAAEHDDLDARPGDCDRQACTRSIMCPSSTAFAMEYRGWQGAGKRGMGGGRIQGWWRASCF